MNIKSLLLGSAAALVAVSGARAADAVVVAEPEPMDYVRICDTYGVGFYYIPGTETCLRISGYMQYDIRGGELLDQISNSGEETYYKRARFQLRVDARSETELGTLRGYVAANLDYVTGASTTQTYTDVNANGVIDATDTITTNRVFDANDGLAIDHLYIELGGFRIGKTDSLFVTMTGYAGNVLTDGQVSYGPFATNQVAYTATFDPITVAIALEEGDEDEGLIIDDYMPHVVAGAAYTAAWGGVSIVGGYDSVNEEGAVKARLDVNATDMISLFVMGGWRSNGDDPARADGRPNNNFGLWNGDWAVWAGGSVKISEATSVNLEVDFAEDQWGGALNVIHEIVPGLTGTAEVAYFDDDDDDDDGEVGVRVRLRRGF